MSFYLAYKRHLGRGGDGELRESRRDASFSSLLGTRILATSAITKFMEKRKYCADYKPLAESITAKSIGIQVAKAGILTFAVGMQEYNTYLDKIIAAQAAEDAGEKVKPVEDFDWKAAQVKYLSAFVTSANRFVSTFVLRRVYESLAVAHLSARAADRLCKDVVKSVKRKLARSYRLRACTSIVTTSIYANIVVYVASLTYDIASFVPAAITFNRLQKGFRIEINVPCSLQDMGIWLNKKLIFYGVCSTSSAIGFAVGAYISEEYGSTLLQTLFETIASIVAAGVLGL